MGKAFGSDRTNPKVVGTRRAGMNRRIRIMADLDEDSHCQRPKRLRAARCALPGSFSRRSTCDPFTITDTHSRYLIRCQIVSRMDLSQVRAVCEAAMREYGMPSRIRTDNGASFAGTGLLGLSKLSLGWMKMGIIHERIQPGHPQQNGRHERMHRTLKEETTRPAALTLRLQQKKFDRFQTCLQLRATSRRTKQFDSRQRLSAKF
jgi:transposase InsO family protein